MAPVRFGSVTVRLTVERFERFWFLVSAVLLGKGFSCVSAQIIREGRFLENGSGGSSSGFGSWKTVLAVPVPISVPGTTVPTVPVSGSGSVPGPSCNVRGRFASPSASKPMV